jgi:uncharacterized repeat protein (TIGR02543 family)
MSDGTITYSAADNGLAIPPSTFTRTLEYPLTVTISGTGTDLDSTLPFRYISYDRPNYGTELNNCRFAINLWVADTGGLLGEEWSNLSENFLPPKIDGWSIGSSGSPAPILEYSLEATATISPASSTATWASASPTSGFVSLTDTPDEDFGYVITFDVQGGTAYPYYKYVTKTAGEVYGTMPIPVRANYVFAGWYSEPLGAGTRVTDVTPVTAADRTLYARWVSFISGPIHNAAGLFSQFIISIGTDVLVEPVSPNLSTSVNTQITMKIPVVTS